MIDDENPSGNLRCFLATERAEGATDDTPIIDGVNTLTIGDLDAVLTELDDTKAKLRAALKALSQVPKAEFFQPGVTYIEQRPFAAPETLSIFHCLTVAEHPRAGAGLRALGFGCHAHPGNDWVSAALTTNDWTSGWSVYTPPERPQ